MCEGGDDLGHPPVLVRGFARETVNEIPLDMDSVLGAPLEEAYVLEGGDAFAHETQDRRAQALDSRLDAADAGSRSTRT